MESDYLVKYYSLERTHWWFVVREKILREQLIKSLPRKDGLKILNVGVATGRTTEMLTDFGAVTSIEFDHNTCEFLRDKLNIPVTEASVTLLPFSDESFDVICVFDVLEHVEFDEKAINELSRVCIADGLIYISCPAYSFLWSGHDIINHHYRRYTAGSLKKLINNKFEVKYLTYFNSILFVPIALYRSIKKIFPSKKRLQSDFDEASIMSANWLKIFFKKLFGTEIFLLKYIKFPFGISILVRAIKK